MNTFNTRLSESEKQISERFKVLFSRNNFNESSFSWVPYDLEKLYYRLHIDYDRLPFTHDPGDPDNILCDVSVSRSSSLCRDKPGDIMFSIGLSSKGKLILAIRKGKEELREYEPKKFNNLVKDIYALLKKEGITILPPVKHTMLRSLTLQNFMSVKEPVTIAISPVTLFFGPNSAGKSAFIRALHYLREIFVNKNINPDSTQLGGTSIDLGGFKNLVHKHDLTKSIIMRLELEVAWKDIPSYNPVSFYLEGDEPETGVNEDSPIHRGEREVIDYFYEATRFIFIEIKIEWNFEREEPLVSYYKTGINDKEFATINLSSVAKNKLFHTIENINMAHPVFSDKFFNQEDWESPRIAFYDAMTILFSTDYMNTVLPVNQNIAIPDWGTLLPVDYSLIQKNSEDWVDKPLYHWLIPEFLTSVVTGPGEVIKNYLEEWIYIGPMREVLERHYKPGLTNNISRWASGLGAWDFLYHKASLGFIEKVNEWLSGYLDSGYEIDMKEYKELDISGPLYIALMNNNVLDDIEDVASLIRNMPIKKRLLVVEPISGLELTPQDIGIGISQILPIIVAALAPDKKVVAIEQPELHVHPAIQVKLGDLFIAAVNDKPGRLFILETHSEHLILRMLRRIEETANENLHDTAFRLKPEQLSVNWFEPDEKGLQVISLPVDESGEFTRAWPRGFFDEREDELFR